MIYSRITKFKKTDAEGNSNYIIPSIRIRVLKTRLCTDHEVNCWEPCQENEIEDQENYEYSESVNDEEKLRFKRPQLSHGYLEEEFIVLYDEEMVYENNQEILDNLKPLEMVEPVLLDDDEIVIYGYPTQYILMHFKNKIGVMINMINNEEFDQPFKFKITDFKAYEK